MVEAALKVINTDFFVDILPWKASFGKFEEQILFMIHCGMLHHLS